MVLALRPAVRATSMNVAPSALAGFSAFCSAASQPNRRETIPRTPSRGSTSVERLNDFRNPRREENKKPSSVGRAKIRRCFYSEQFPAFAIFVLHSRDANRRPVFATSCHSTNAAGLVCGIGTTPRPDSRARTFTNCAPVGVFLRYRNPGWIVRQRSRKSGSLGLSSENFPELPPELSHRRTKSPSGDTRSHGQCSP